MKRRTVFRNRHAVVLVAVLCLATSCVTGSGLATKVASIGNGDTRESVLQRLGPAGDRQFSGDNEVLQYCSQTVPPIGYTAARFTVVWLFKGHVTGLTTYSGSLGQTCRGGYQTVRWADAPGRPGAEASAALPDSVASDRKSAEEGLATAQFSLGYRYAVGSGVPQDDAESLKWFRRAAEQGMAMAQYNLGFMYVSGRGVAKDRVKAYMWTSLAAKHLEGEEPNQRAKTNIEILLTEMSQAELAEAKRQVAAWKPSKP